MENWLLRRLTLFWLFLSTVLVHEGWSKNECEHKSGKSLFGMNLLFLHCFIWIKDLKWYMKSNSNNFKRNQFNCLHSQGERQTECFFLSWLLVDILFFIKRKKKRFQKFLFKGALLPCAFKIIQRLLKNIKVCGRRACLQYNRSNTFLDKYFF